MSNKPWLNRGGLLAGIGGVATEGAKDIQKEAFLRIGHPEENYEIGKKIGQGSFATVYRGVNKRTKVVYALKQIHRKDDFDTNLIKEEIKMLRRVDAHKNIIELREVYELPDSLWLVTGMVEGEELFDLIVKKGTHSEMDSARVVRQLFEALHYLHERGIIHRDIKPENVLCKRRTGSWIEEAPDVFLADFGLATCVEPSRLLTMACGTPAYVAPEILSGEGYAAPVDNWSAGVITYILLVGYQPFFHEDQSELFEMILSGQYHMDEQLGWEKVGDPAKDFINRLLDSNPRTRMTSGDALKHPWLVGGKADTNNNDDAAKRLKEFNARRKLKAGMDAVKLVQSMGAMLSHKHKSDDPPARHMPLQFYTLAGSTNCAGPHVLLEAAGVDYETVTKVPFNDGENGTRHASHLSKFPSGQCPAIEDDGLRAFECGAVMRYIANKHLSTLGDDYYPAGDFARRAEIDSAFDFVNTTVYAAITKAAYPVLGFAPALSEDDQKAANDALLDLLNSRIVALQMDGKKYLCGDKPTIADVRFAPTLLFARVAVVLPERLAKYLEDVAAEVKGWETGCATALGFTADKVKK